MGFVTELCYSKRNLSLYDELHYSKLKQRKTYVELLYTVHRHISDHQGGQVNNWPHRYVPSQTKENENPCNHKTCIKHEEIKGFM